MSASIIKNGKDIGYIISFITTPNKKNTKTFRMCVDISNDLILNDELQIKHFGERKIYNYKIIRLDRKIYLKKFIYFDFVECIVFPEQEQTKVKEDHQGKIYNPYTDSWSWL